MNLKLIIITALCTITTLQCCEVKNTVIIRPATLDDLDGISAIPINNTKTPPNLCGQSIMHP